MDSQLVKACINLDAIKFNIQTLKSLIPKDSKFMAVVKADGYGHGAINVARTALEAGANWLGVARLEEAEELRSSGISAPILVFGYIHPQKAKIIADLDLVATVYDLKMAKELSKQAASLNKKITAHIKVDTGMGRVGMVVKGNDKISDEIEAVCNLPNLEIKGIYTHCAAADMPELEYTDKQIQIFKSLLNNLKTRNIKFELCHAANSGGIIDFKQSHFDMVRAGISIYGCYPSNTKESTKIILKPAMTIKSIITSVKKVPENFYVSYGMTHKTPEKTCLASVPIGYADGFSRGFSSNGFMLVKGYKAPIVGRVCMDQTMIDVGGIPDVKPGDEVVVLGTQGKMSQSAEDLASRINTINYEIVSALTARVKKTYSGSGSGWG